MDFVNEVTVYKSIDPASITATTTGSAVDCYNAIDCVAVIPVGTVTTADATNLITFTATECDTSDGDFTTLATTGYLQAENMAGTTWDRIINATTEGSNVYRFQFVPSKRYVKIVGTETGTTSAVYGAYVEFRKRSS